MSKVIWLSFGASCAPVISGFLVKAKGWRWFHWLTAILAGANMIASILFLPETQYSRDLYKAMDVSVEADVVDHAPKRSLKAEMEISKAEPATVLDFSIHDTGNSRISQVEW